MSRSPSPVNYRRQQAGFVPATQRERCGNCAQVRIYSTINATEYSCQSVGFTSAWSICKHWTKKGATPT
jgi:hypothetical protein